MSAHPLPPSPEGDLTPGTVDLALALATPGGSRYIWRLLNAHSPAAARHLSRIDGPLVEALTRSSPTPARAIQARERVAADLLVVYIRTLASLRPQLAALASGETSPRASARERTLLTQAVARALSRRDIALDTVTLTRLSEDVLSSFAVALAGPTPPAQRDPRKVRPQFLPAGDPGDLPEDLLDAPDED